MTVLLGSSSAGADSANSNLSQTEFGVRLQCVASGTVTSIFVKSADALTNRRGALYADNAGQLTGGARLSADITPPTAAGAWHEYAVSPGVDVTVGSFYWLTFVCTSGVYNYTDFATSGGTTRDTTGITTLAATHPSTTSNFTNLFNAYADGTLAVPPFDADYSLFPKSKLRRD